MYSRFILFRIIVYIVMYIHLKKESILEYPVEYYKKMKGKNTRGILCNYIGLLYNIPADHIEIIKQLCNNCHNASLVIDDIEDNSDYRRGHLAAHKVYGIPYALNSSYLAAFRMLHKLPDVIQTIVTDENNRHMQNRIMNHVIQSLYEMHIGQGLDIYWSTYKITPSMCEYMEMIEQKTGTLFTIINDIASILQPNKLPFHKIDEMNNALRLLSHFFQIRDDFLNITCLKMWKQKQICEDFDAYKQTYMIILFYHHPDISKDDKNSFFEIFYKKNKTKREKGYLISVLHDYNILENTYQYISSIVEIIKNIILIPFLFEKLHVLRYDIDELYRYLDYSKTDKSTINHQSINYDQKLPTDK